MLDREKVLPAFSLWGFKQQGSQGVQAYGECPFCGKPKKFYVNTKSGLWDCKVCFAKGNYLQFLGLIAKKNEKQLSNSSIKALRKERGLPYEAFQNFGIGISGSTYTIPVYSENGNVQDLRRFKLGSKMRASIGCEIGLWGLNRLSKMQDSSAPIFLCEGEWDGIAMSWLLKTLQKPGVVVAVPGAGIFKNDWVRYFNKRVVYVCYDNDDAGRQGEIIVHDRLKDTARVLNYLHWPTIKPDGYDIRDIVSLKAFKGKKPKKTWKVLNSFFVPTPRKYEDVHRNKNIVVSGEEVIAEIKLEQVFEVFKKWLYLKNTDGIEIMLSTVVANKIQGDPIWMFLVAPPGSAKTELIQSLNDCQVVHAVSSLTPHSLISGSPHTGGKDPSLISTIKDKVLSIKDFTTIMQMRDSERDEIFGILRDAYDGTCSKTFGNGITRSYKSKFGIIAGVTPVIYHLDAQSQSLGERFLKFSIEANLKHEKESAIIDTAIGNINQETAMRSELCDIVRKFIEWTYYKMADLPTDKLPTLPQEIKEDIVALVKFGARMRGTVSRDKYRTEMINARPSSEIGSRLGKQLAKLTQAIAIVNGRNTVDFHDYDLVKKCMMDTISQKIEDVVRCLHEECPTQDDSINTKAVSVKTKYPQSTVVRTLQDLTMLELVRRVGGANKAEWTLTKYSRSLIKKANIYPKISGELKQTKEKQNVESI